MKKPQRVRRKARFKIGMWAKWIRSQGRGKPKFRNVVYLRAKVEGGWLFTIPSSHLMMFARRYELRPLTTKEIGPRRK